MRALAGLSRHAVYSSQHTELYVEKKIVNSAMQGLCASVSARYRMVVLLQKKHEVVTISSGLIRCPPLYTFRRRLYFGGFDFRVSIIATKTNGQSINENKTHSTSSHFPSPRRRKIASDLLYTKDSRVRCDPNIRKFSGARIGLWRRAANRQVKYYLPCHPCLTFILESAPLASSMRFMDCIFTMRV
jgi:hypothetical protein